MLVASISGRRLLSCGRRLSKSGLKTELLAENALVETVAGIE
jgi:hypothetical protein